MGESEEEEESDDDKQVRRDVPSASPGLKLTLPSSLAISVHRLERFIIRLRCLSVLAEEALIRAYLDAWVMRHASAQIGAGISIEGGTVRPAHISYRLNQSAIVTP